MVAPGLTVTIISPKNNSLSSTAVTAKVSPMTTSPTQRCQANKEISLYGANDSAMKCAVKCQLSRRS
jgi:hypothetical protein